MNSSKEHILSMDRFKHMKFNYRNIQLGSVCLFAITIIISSCYSFKGITIPDDIDTFDIPFVEVNTPDAPPSVNIVFQDKLIQKITRESRLLFNDNQPDIRLNASITRYIVESIGANAQNTSDANRLKISVEIKYEDLNNEENSWKNNFSNTRDFGQGVNLLSVQDELIDQIFDDIVEDIFNKAFTNW